MKKQALGRAIRSKEPFETFIKRLDSSLSELGESHRSDMEKHGYINYFKEVKVDSKDLQRLLLEVQGRDLMILPGCDGFRPTYEICEIEGNPLYEYEKKVLMRMHERQFPENFSHKDMKEFFGSKRNLELAKLVNENISLVDSRYYY